MPGGEPGVQVRWASGSEDLARSLALRERVFVLEQGVSREEEIDGRDSQALHALAFTDGGALIGTLRLLLEGEVAKIGRVAVERRHRRQGVATRLLELAIGEARARGACRARLAAQLGALGLYERAGFDVESAVFVEAGIEHVWMGRAL